MIYFARTDDGEIASTVFVNEATGEMFTHRSGDPRGFQKVQAVSNLGGVDLTPIINAGAQFGVSLYNYTRATGEQRRQEAAATSQNEAQFLSQVYTPVFQGLDALIAAAQARGIDAASAIAQADQLQKFWSTGVQQSASMVFSDYGRSWMTGEASAAVASKVNQVKQLAAQLPQTSASVMTNAAATASAGGFPLWVVIALVAGVFLLKR